MALKLISMTLNFYYITQCKLVECRMCLCGTPAVVSAQYHPGSKVPGTELQTSFRMFTR